jgi:hypothetical protein
VLFHGREDRLGHARVVLLEYPLPVFTPLAGRRRTQRGTSRERLVQDEARVLDALLVRGRLDRADRVRTMPHDVHLLAAGLVDEREVRVARDAVVDLDGLGFSGEVAHEPARLLGRGGVEVRRDRLQPPDHPRTGRHPARRGDDTRPHPRTAHRLGCPLPLLLAAGHEGVARLRAALHVANVRHAVRDVQREVEQRTDGEHVRVHVPERREQIPAPAVDDERVRGN